MSSADFDGVAGRGQNPLSRSGQWVKMKHPEHCAHGSRKSGCFFVSGLVSPPGKTLKFPRPIRSVPMDRLKTFKPPSPRIWMALGLAMIPILFLLVLSFFLLQGKRPRIQSDLAGFSRIAYDLDSIERSLTALAFSPTESTSRVQGRPALAPGYLAQIRADVMDILSLSRLLTPSQRRLLRDLPGVSVAIFSPPSTPALSRSLKQVSLLDKAIQEKQSDLTRRLETVDVKLERTGGLIGAVFLLLGGFLFVGIREVRRSFMHLALYEALQRSDNGIAFLDPVTGRFLFANEGFLSLSGYTSGELSGCRLKDLFPGDPGVLTDAGSKGAFGGGSLETDLTGKGGVPVPVELRLERSSFQGREMFLLMVLDRSRKKELEEKNRAILEHLDALLKNLGEGLLELNREGVVLSANPMAGLLLGYDEEELVGKSLPEGVLPDDAARKDRFRECIARVLSRREVLEDDDLVFLKKNASTLLAFGVFSPVESKEAGSDSTVLLAFRDIAPRKAIEAELRASESLNREIVENSPDGIYILDPESFSLFEGNIRFARMIGFDNAESLRGLPLKTFATRPEGEIRRNMSRIYEPGGWEITESIFRKKDGETLPVSINAVPIVFRGRPAVLVTVRDITFRRQVEQSNLLFLDLDQLILDGTPPRMLYQTITDRLVGIFPFVHARLMLSGRDGNPRTEAISARDPEMLLQMNRLTEPAPGQIRLRQGEVRFGEISELSPPWTDWRKAGRFGGLYYLPFLFSGDRPLGAMEISLKPGETINDAMVSLLEDIAGRLALFGRHRQELSRIRLLEKAFEVTPAPAFIANSEGEVEWANPAYYALVGGSADSVLGKVHPFLKNTARKKGEDDPWRRLRRGQSVEGEFVHPRVGEKDFLGEIRISPLLDEEKNLVNLVAIETDITRERRKEKELRLLAFHDPLTNLPNRAALDREFEGYLSTSRRHRRLLAVLFFDLDGFKEVNDSLGHEAGDHLLSELSRRLAREIRSGDRLFRLGGDEFLVILNNVSGRSEIERGACRILEVIHQPIDLAGQEVRIGASIGIALFPEDAKSQQDLLRMSDMAMYRAKNRGKNRIVFYGQDPDSDSDSDLRDSSADHRA